MPGMTLWWKMMLPAAVLAAACTQKSPAPQGIPEPAVHVNGEVASDALAFNLFRHVVRERKGNVVFSPDSAEKLLHLLQAGAAGSTRAQLDALPYGKRGVPSAMKVESANALFADDSLKLKPSPAEVQRVPFSAAPARAAERVNAWCSDHTHGKVAHVVSPPDIHPQTRLMAANAVYLNEKWLHPFKASATKDAPFTLADGSQKTVQMMDAELSCRYAEGADWKAVALMYAPAAQGEPGCFIGILPKGNARRFAETLDAAKYSAIRTALAKSTPENVQVSLPRLTLQPDRFSLREALLKQGVRDAFTANADFSGFSDTPLQLADVFQKCYVKVDEQGTEAAAVTIATVDYTCVQMNTPPSIRFDKPFIWAIGDLTTPAPPYFIGLCEQP